MSFPAAGAPVSLPHALNDGLRIGYWCRPEHYRAPVVRQASSTFGLPSRAVGSATARLPADLEARAGQGLNAGLLEKEHTDYGYQLVHAGEETPRSA